jgi:hypothetical protein
MIFTSLTDALADMMAEMFYIYIILRFGNMEIIWEDVKKNTNLRDLTGLKS